jgi:hypothetical protein
MKKIINILIVFFAVAVVFTACKKDDKEPVLDTTATVSPAWVNAPAPETHFNLNADSADVALTVLEWSEVVYPLNDLPSPLYTVQLFLAEGGLESSWGEPINLLTLPEKTNTITHLQLNTAIIKVIGKEFPADTVVSAAFRIKANVNANDVASTIDAFTDIAPFTVTPYVSADPGTVPSLWVPGDHQGWDPATAPNVWSADDNGVYTGYVYFPEGGTFEFKFTSAPDWNHTNFGAGANEGSLDTDPTAGNLIVPAFGGYVLTCDTNARTWTHEAQSWGVIGSGILAGDWSEDIDLEFDADNNVLTVTADVTEPTDGSELRFKFRANDGWDINYGLTDPVDGNNLSQGGPDIPMPDGAGNYTFILNLSQATPTYELIKN